MNRTEFRIVTRNDNGFAEPHRELHVYINRRLGNNKSTVDLSVEYLQETFQPYGSDINIYLTIAKLSTCNSQSTFTRNKTNPNPTKVPGHNITTEDIREFSQEIKQTLIL